MGDLKVEKAVEFLKLTDKSFFTRLLQMLSERVCNGRSDRPLISVAACGCGSCERDAVTLFISSLWLADAGR